MRNLVHGDHLAEYSGYVQKLVWRSDDLELRDSWLKWYEIGPEGVDLAAVSAECRTLVTTLETTGELDVQGCPGFVEVHYCSEVVFLIVMTWTNENELWQSVWVREHGDIAFERTVREHKGHRPMLCVWELMPVSHERDAWVGYLRSRRSSADLAAYRASTFEGMC